MRKFKIITINLPPDFADLYPQLVVHGRGQDPRGYDIAAWAREEAARLKRLEAKRLAAEGACKPEAAE
jgi:hypothetical protein